MDFITGFPKTKRYHDAIMVVVDKLSKVVHFIHIKSTYKAINIVEIFMKEIFRIHGIPKTIISDRDAKFTSKFWKDLFEGSNKQLGFSIDSHPQNNGQTKRTNRILEDMLRIYVMDKLSK